MTRMTMIQYESDYTAYYKMCGGNVGNEIIIE